MNHRKCDFSAEFKIRILFRHKKYFKSIRITFRTPSEITISFFRFSFFVFEVEILSV